LRLLLCLSYRQSDIHRLVELWHGCGKNDVGNRLGSTTGTVESGCEQKKGKKKKKKGPLNHPFNGTMKSISTCPGTETDIHQAFEAANGSPRPCPNQHSKTQFHTPHGISIQKILFFAQTSHIRYPQIHPRRLAWNEALSIDRKANLGFC